MDCISACEIMGFGAMFCSFANEFIGFGVMGCNFAHGLIGFGSMDRDFCFFLCLLDFQCQRVRHLSARRRWIRLTSGAFVVFRCTAAA